MCNTNVDHDPPHNFIATPLSPSTVKFTWEPPEESTNEVFILTCEPQPYQFPVSTRATTLKSGHFTPDTEYVCRIFTAQIADINNSSTTVHFSTGMIIFKGGGGNLPLLKMVLPPPPSPQLSRTML